MRQITKKERAAFIAATKSSNILTPADLNESVDGIILHFGTVGSPDPRFSPPSYSITVETINGERLSRCFRDKLESAGLGEGDHFLASFIEKNGYANVQRITIDNPNTRSSVTKPAAEKDAIPF